MSSALVVGLTLALGCLDHAPPLGSSPPPPAALVPVSVYTLDGVSLNPLEPKSDGWTVLIFMRTDCPVANRYAPEINRLADEFSSRGVKFYRVYPDLDETSDVIREHTVEYEHVTRSLWDPQQWLATQVGATVTPEAVLLDPGGTIVYQGRIDNRWVAYGQARREANRRDLRLALEAALAGQPIDVPRTEAVGCLISDLR